MPGFTVRNASDRSIEVARGRAGQAASAGSSERLHRPSCSAWRPGSHADVGWDDEGAVNSRDAALGCQRQAKREGGRGRRPLKVTPEGDRRRAGAHVPGDDSAAGETAKRSVVKFPDGANPGPRRGARSLSASGWARLAGVQEYMSRYPYTCFEQLASQADRAAGRGTLGRPA